MYPEGPCYCYVFLILYLYEQKVCGREEIVRKGPFPYRSDNATEPHCYRAAAFFLSGKKFSR